MDEMILIDAGKYYNSSVLVVLVLKPIIRMFNNFIEYGTYIQIELVLIGRMNQFVYVS